MTKKKQRLFELHEGQNMWVNQQFPQTEFTTATGLVRHVFALGMAEYIKRNAPKNEVLDQNALFTAILNGGNL